jgi:uncharacterized protein (TIGR02266 family)
MQGGPAAAGPAVQAVPEAAGPAVQGVPEAAGPAVQAVPEAAVPATGGALVVPAEEVSPEPARSVADAEADGSVPRESPPLTQSTAPAGLAIPEEPGRPEETERVPIPARYLRPGAQDAPTPAAAEEPSAAGTFEAMPGQPAASDSPAPPAPQLEQASESLLPLAHEPSVEDTERIEVSAVSPGGVNGRRAPRFPIKVEVSYTSEHNFYTGFLENISSGGLFVATHAPASLGDVLELTFSVPGLVGICTAVGRVKWLREYNPMDPEMVPGIGLQFAQLEPEARAAIELFIRHRDPIFFDDE